MEKIRGALFFLTLALAPAWGQESSWPELSHPPKGIGGGEKDAAVIIGAENYLLVAKVPGARRNAQDWHSYLTDSLGVPSDRVSLLRDNEATLEKMTRFAKKAAEEVEPGGTLWFVFIGHGAPSRDGRDGLLVGADAQQDPDGLFARSLPRGELLKILDKGRQAKTVVVLDACFSGRSSSGETLVAGLQPLVLTQDLAGKIDGRTILMTAAKSDQFAGPLPKAPQMRPAFSYLALGALRGWAADAQGKVTASAIVDFARKALALDKGRVQTPELTLGAPTSVLGRGRERAPDLGKIDREGAAPSGGPDFQVSNLSAVPRAEAPKALDLGASGLDLRNIDVEALGKYDDAFTFDKSNASPEDKAETWRTLAEDAPAYAALAKKRAADWDRFAEQNRAAEEARQKRVDARDLDWEKLSKLLAYKVVPEADKKRWAGQFVGAYMQSPGLEPGSATALAKYIPAGPVKNALRELAKAAPVQIAPAAAPAAGNAGIRWVTIPGGSFMMGSGENSDEKPRHSVAVKPFRMAKSVVTGGQYKKCVAAGACENPGCAYLGDDYPVVCVTWDQARKFSEWAGGRLPTEAEWEYAARSAGKDWKYPWGNEDATCEKAVISGCGKNMAPVCSKPAGNTKQGLCDMSGNVWQWTQDWYHSLYTGAPADGSAWETPPGTTRVNRGGSWYDDLGFARASYRSYGLPGNRSDRVGFRPARDAAKP